MIMTMNEVSGFAALPLAEPLHRALVEKNYSQPSPIQAQAIPHLLEKRFDRYCPNWHG